MVNLQMVELAKASYERCCAAPDFFDAFYHRFLEECPAAIPKFARTDFIRQNKLLRHAFGLLLSFAKQPPAESSLLARVAERHSRRDLNVDASMYTPFVDSLIATVQRYDPKFTPAVEEAWRATLTPGVEYMKSKY